MEFNGIFFSLCCPALPRVRQGNLYKMLKFQYKKALIAVHQSQLSEPVAEKEGFEPSRQLSQPTPLAAAVFLLTIPVNTVFS